MYATNAPSVSAFKTRLRFGRVMFAAVFIFAIAATVRGQAPTPQPGVRAQQPHWHKYVNRKYGFSFSYPDPYRPVPVRSLDENAKKYYHYEDLLLLQRSNDQNENEGIQVTIDVRPFHMGPRGRNDNTPKGRLIGGHISYSYIEGGPGTGFADVYEMNLRGKSLLFGFEPEGMNPGPKTRQLEPKILKTLQTF
jgi:hypothetical protein